MCMFLARPSRCNSPRTMITSLIYRSPLQTFTLTCYCEGAKANVYYMSKWLQIADVNLSSSFKVLWCDVNEDRAIQSDARLVPCALLNKHWITSIDFHSLVHYELSRYTLCLWNLVQEIMPSPPWLCAVITKPKHYRNDLTMGRHFDPNRHQGKVSTKIWRCSVASLTSFFWFEDQLSNFYIFLSYMFCLTIFWQSYAISNFSITLAPRSPPRIPIGVVDLLGWSNSCSRWTTGWRRRFGSVVFLCDP